MGIYKPAPAYSDEEITLFIARKLRFDRKQLLDSDEFLEVELVPMTEACNMVMGGKITDGKTQVAIMKMMLCGNENTNRVDYDK